MSAHLGLAAALGCAVFGTTILPFCGITAPFRAPPETPREVVRGFLWVEAEGFSDYGNWRLDTQFVHKMGSGYLLAAGVLKPLGKATTKLTIPSAGTWTVWARTKD